MIAGLRRKNGSRLAGVRDGLEEDGVEQDGGVEVPEDTAWRQARDRRRNRTQDRDTTSQQSSMATLLHPETQKRLFL